MKLYKIYGRDYRQTHIGTRIEVASGLSSRQAAERVMVALATQGVSEMSIESYDSDEQD